VIDGPVLVADALAAGVELLTAYVDVGAADPVPALADRLRGAGVEVHVLAAGVLARSTDTVTPQGIAAVARRPAAPAAPGRVPALLLVLAGVADPGNAGTLLRSAEAAGATGVWCTSGSVDVYGPKAVRASAGSLFRVPVRDEVEAAAAVADLRTAGTRVLGTVARGGTPPDEVDLGGPCALVLGNEAHGLDPVWHDAVDEWLTVPIAGRAESLNVAMAGTVLCFEAARQRRRRPGGGERIQRE
jgi:TrmH family RNA methyltransferase